MIHPDRTDEFEGVNKSTQVSTIQEDGSCRYKWMIWTVYGNMEEIDGVVIGVVGWLAIVVVAITIKA